jgi:DNA invertase Pin-like site-specific DNA recombinase
MGTAMATKAYSYLRFSTPEQQQGDSFRRQTQLAADYARQHGLELDTSLTFQDLGVSAYRSKNAKRGALRAFLNAVEDGEIEQGSYLLVEALDRISRDQILAAQGLFLQIIEAGITLVTLADRRVYSAASINANPTDLIISLVGMMRANEESATKSRRLAAAWEAKRSKAAERPLTAVAPAWLTLDSASRTFQVIPERAAVVQRIYREAAVGRGQHAITADLNRDGIPTFGHRGRQASQWHVSYVVKLLRSAAVIGTYTPHRIEYQRGTKRRVPLEPVPDYFPAIIDEDTYQQVRAIRSGGRQPLRGRNTTVSNVLGGLARCPICGHSMTLVTKSERWRYLICTKAKAGAGCVYRTVRYVQVEQAIIANVGAIVRDCPPPDPSGARIVSRMESIADEQDQLREAIAALLAHAGKVRSPAIAQEIVRLEQEVVRLQAEERQLADHVALVIPTRLQARLDGLERAAKALPVDRAAINAAMRSLMKIVVVDYRVGRLVFHWQHDGESDMLYGWPEEANMAQPVGTQAA